MKEYDLIVIGAGIAGITGAISALESGVKDVLVLEREENYGGVLNQCIHCGFSLGEEKITGPELIEYEKKILDKYDYTLKLKATVLEISPNKKVTYISEEDGINIVKAKAILIATGCRERYTGSVLIPTSKYTGVFTIGNAHRILNLDGVLPGKNPVVIANNKWALIVARRIEIEGGKVKALIVNRESGYKIPEEDREILEGFNINLIENAKLLEVAGKKRVSSVKIMDLDTCEEKKFDCDSLLLSVGYYPELSMVDKLDIDMDKESKCLRMKNHNTSIPWVFACGNIVYGDNYIIEKSKSGTKAGKEVAKYIQSLEIK